jgi:CO dehydrogenase/acetyl-CoA synthase gamma subunit (corrinoid Fe-S protein)
MKMGIGNEAVVLGGDEGVCRKKEAVSIGGDESVYRKRGSLSG